MPTHPGPVERVGVAMRATPEKHIDAARRLCLRGRLEADRRRNVSIPERRVDLTTNRIIIKFSSKGDEEIHERYLAVGILGPSSADQDIFSDGSGLGQRARATGQQAPAARSAEAGRMYATASSAARTFRRSICPRHEQLAAGNRRVLGDLESQTTYQLARAVHVRVRVKQDQVGRRRIGFQRRTQFVGRLQNTRPGRLPAL